MQHVLVAYAARLGRVLRSPRTSARILASSGARFAAGHAVGRVIGEPAFDLLLAIWRAIP